MYTITKKFEFDAAHSLPNHEGKCKRVHGHRFSVEITVSGHIQTTVKSSPEYGMIMDFKKLDSIIKPLSESYLDHHNLNETIGYPTAELILEWIINRLSEHFFGGLWLERVRIYETPNNWVEWENKPCR